MQSLIKKQSSLYQAIYFLLLIFSFGLTFSVTKANAISNCTPGWSGTILIDGDSLTNWSVESDTGASGLVESSNPIINGQSVLFNWDFGSGEWVQAKYSFSTPVDLSSADIFGISLQGDANAPSNRVTFMFADVNDVFYGYNIDGINHIDRSLFNIPIPKKAFNYFFGGDSSNQINWSQINRFFVTMKKPGSGGNGRLKIDHVQYDTAANWPRQTTFESITPNSIINNAASKTVNYIISQQKETGLIPSWKEESPQKSYLYDQALALIILTREGFLENNTTALQAAQNLANFLINNQKIDQEGGHWARIWNSNTGVEIADDGWVGDQAWVIMALAIYANKAGYIGESSLSAYNSAQKGANWLELKISPTGQLTNPDPINTEGTIGAWGAMIATDRVDKANKIKNYLLTEVPNGVWDSDLQYWWRGYNDPVIAMDAATWLSEFSRHSLVNEPNKGIAALSFVSKTLITRDDSETLCGFDGMGPVSIWNDGVGQYIAAGGENSQEFLDMLISQQRSDGAMPGSPDNWSSGDFGWLSNWSGLAATSWLYFAIKGGPFPKNIIIKQPPPVPASINIVQSTTTYTTNINAQIEFQGLKNFYNIGEVAIVSLVETIEPESSQDLLDLWIAIEMPNGELFFKTAIPAIPFSLEAQPFKQSIENTENIQNVIHFEVPIGMGGNYIFYGLYVETGTNPLTDGFTVFRSNLARQETTLANE